MRLLDEGIPGIPKKISPQQHKVLDILTAATFGVAAAFLWPGNRKAAIAALLNGAFVSSYSQYTDYDGDGAKPISFETHGKLDVAQAGFAAVAPLLFGFADEKKSWFFWGQAMNETLVLAMTDFESSEESDVRTLAA